MFKRAIPLRRSVLYVPCSNVKAVDKTLKGTSIGADCIIYDLEVGVRSTFIVTRYNLILI